MIHTVSVARRRARLGDTAQTVVGAGAQAAGTALATVQAASSAGLITLGGSLAAAVPIAGALVAVGVLAFSLLHNSRGLQQDAETTAVVNKAEAAMKQNLAAWNASGKSLASQQQALKNFDDAWAAIENFCSNPNEGSPGQRCVSERTRGGKYDYFAAYRDPIANDPSAGLVDKAAAEAAAMNLSGSEVASILQTSNPAAFLIPAGLVVAALLAVKR